MESDTNRPLSTAARIRALRDQALSASPAAMDEIMTTAFFTTLESLVEDTSRHSTLKEFQFISTTPVVGPLLAAFRSAFNAIAPKWATRAVIQQQNQYNLANARVLRELLSLNRVLLTRVYELENRIATLEAHAQDSSRSG